MAGRKVAEGRGAVFAGGRVFAEGEEIPGDVKVGEHVFASPEVQPAPALVDTSEPVAGAGDADATAGESGRSGKGRSGRS